MNILPCTAETVLAILRQAADAILEIYLQDNLSISYKDDSSPLTLADSRSHEILSSGLAALSDAPVVSEESESLSGIDSLQPYWLIDPLDGTKDFIARNGEFTVNVAFMSGGVPVAGFVSIPAEHSVYFALQGQGAFRIGPTDTAPQHISYQAVNGRCCLSESRFHAAEETEKLAQALGATEIKTFGSALKLCRFAEGAIDLYPRFNPTCIWDTAAAHCIVRESGGELYSLPGGETLSYSLSKLVNSPFVVCAPDFYPAVSAGLRKIGYLR